LLIKLQNLTELELWDELAGARRELQEQLGQNTSAVAYPVGGSLHRYPKVAEAVRRAGYTCGFTNMSGTATVRQTYLAPFDIKRLSVEASLTPSYFRAILALPCFAELSRSHRRDEKEALRT
jgi:hypothetical protein